jgi:Ca2+-binding RTX toxin-like protein
MTGNWLTLESITNALTVNLGSGPGDEVTDGTNTLNWENDVIDMLTVSGEGNDTVTGNSAANFLQILDGDSDTGDPGGDDMVSGEGGNDRIRSLDEGGNDTVDGGEGDDTIDVKDGFGGDSVDCGEGNDTVSYDEGLDPNPERCETLNS